MPSQHRILRSQLIALILISASLTACATAPTQNKPDPEPAPEAATQTSREKNLQSIIQQLTQRLEEMEGKLTAMNDKIDATRAGVETLALSGKSNAVPTTVAVLPHPVDTSRSAGISTEKAQTATESGTAYVHSSAIQMYRKAMILLETQKWRDAILQFGQFLDQHPDHILAGSAQYHIGESYFHLGELKLAAQEFQRVLTSYDRSVFVPETHRHLASIHAQLKDSKQASQHEQTLARLYPQSPAAKEVMNPALQKSGIERPSAPKTETAELVKPEAPPSTFQSTTPGLDAPPETTQVPTAPSGLDSHDQNHSEHTGTVAPHSSSGENTHP